LGEPDLAERLLPFNPGGEPWMATPIRLLAKRQNENRTVQFSLNFAAQSEGNAQECALASLDTGDGHTLDLGMICSPTGETWPEQHTVQLAGHAYAEAQPYRARLVWGSQSVEALVEWEEQAFKTGREAPRVRHFSVEAAPENLLALNVEIEFTPSPNAHHIRVDGGPGNVHWLTLTAQSDDLPGLKHAWTFLYNKPGAYQITVDLLDDEGYWVESLVVQPVDIRPPLDEAEQAANEDALAAGSPPSSINESHAEVQALSALPPWLPFQYARPLWAWARTYTRAGGTIVSRSLALGTYLAIRSESIVGGQLWYQTGSNDWIPASSVALLTPSNLRGIELAPTAPPPEPEPGAPRRGVVTADVLNVRSGPGVSYPVVAQLRLNAEVLIYEQATAAGAVWYRIGRDRWVHSGWVRLLSGDTPPPPPPAPTREGIVTADVLNVRARPGVSADNPPIARLYRGAQVTIFEERIVDGAKWYRIGADRWVHSAWVKIVAANEDMLPLQPDSTEVDVMAAPQLPVGWVVASSLTVRAQPSATAAVVGTLAYKQSLSILDTQLVAGQRWYRIGAGQWVYGPSVGVARFKARPASIRSSERWVGVNLREQTVVAYEGDKPVYAALAATGLAATPTVQGVFRTWLRLVSRKMSGGSAATGGYYYLEEVPWTCYFYSGYALHAAYWHDAFGRPRSHGCVNLSPYDAWWIFRWSEAGGANSPAVFVYWE
jgi:hypothetical protein